MIELPLYISVIFVITFTLTLILFFRAANFSFKSKLFFFFWVILQAVLAYAQFYLNLKSFPPRFLFVLFPPILLISITFITTKGKVFINQLNTKTLTIIHFIRVPIEVVLYLLFIHKAIPELMTFSGRNFDILAGLSAPIIYYFGFVKKTMNAKVILIWNIVCLILLVNIIVNAVLSAPLLFQQFAFDQPNVALLYFPFVWLPAVIVPIVLFSHLTSIKQFSRKSKGWNE